MLKIKNFFIKHSKLKRLIKIFGIVSIVLSFLFNIVIIASVIINANNDNVKRPLVYDTLNVPVKSMADNGTDTKTHYFIGTGDLSFTTFYTNIVEIYGDSARYDNPTTYNSLSTSRGDFTLDRIDFCTMDSDMLEYNTAYDITRIDFYKVNYAINSMPCVLYSLDVFFQYDANTTRNLSINFYVYKDLTYFGSNTAGYVVNTDIYLYYNYARDYDIANYYFTLYANNQTGIFYDLFVHNRDRGYLNGYVDGYASGLTTGKDVGYAEGYQDGIDYAGSHSMTSDPFTLISRAFTSVASILNIQVLPNLTLGVLIFTPLIVTIIVVVVKFMRG